KADFVDKATPALGSPRLAHIATVQDQPVMGTMLVALRHDPVESKLHLQRGLTGREPGAVRNPESMRVDGDRALAKGDVEHDIGGLAPDAGERLKRFAIIGTLLSCCSTSALDSAIRFLALER